MNVEATAKTEAACSQASPELSMTHMSALYRFTIHVTHRLVCFFGPFRSWSSLFRILLPLPFHQLPVFLDSLDVVVPQLLLVLWFVVATWYPWTLSFFFGINFLPITTLRWWVVLDSLGYFRLLSID